MVSLHRRGSVETLTELIMEGDIASGLTTLQLLSETGCRHREPEMLDLLWKGKKPENDLKEAW